MNRILVNCCFLLITSCWLACQPDPCERRDCQNGGICIDGTCECPENFIGPDCTIEIDPCIQKDCKSPNTESCDVNDQDQAICTCKDGFEGEFCESEWVEKFQGRFNAIEECDGVSGIFDVVVEKGPEFKRFTMINFHNEKIDSLALEAKVVAKMITPLAFEIQEQFMFFGTVEGGGLFINEDQVSMNFSIVADGDTTECFLTLERK
ncbi:MAG: hypothetical protein AAF399_00400 [Bacteroidota bacterium]